MSNTRNFRDVDEEDISKSRKTKTAKKVDQEVDKLFLKEKKLKMKQGQDDEEMQYIGNQKSQNRYQGDDSDEFNNLINTKKPAAENDG